MLAEVYLPNLSVRTGWPRRGFPCISSRVGCVAALPAALGGCALVCLWESEGCKEGDACAGHCVLCNRSFFLQMVLHLCACGKQVSFSNIVIKAVGITARHLPLRWQDISSCD